MVSASFAAGAMQWNATYGGTGDDKASSVQQTSDGGYIAAGYTNSFGAGGNDFWLVKTDSTGAQQWNRTFGGSNSDVATSVQQTTDGGYIVAGYTNSFGAGSYDVWLVKTDSTGAQQWNKTFGRSGDDIVYEVQQTSDGGYIAAGYTNSGGYYNFLLLKTNSTGAQQWNQTYGGTGIDWARSVRQTSDGGYIVAGYTTEFGAGGSDIWLVKTNSTGGQQWNATLGGTGGEEATSVRQTSDGGYIVGGGTDSSGAGNFDFFLVKTNSTGAQQWNATYGGANFDEIESVRQTSDGGYIAAGYTFSFGAGNDDFWLVKTDSTGAQQWNATYGGTGFDLPSSVQQTSDGGYIAAGSTNSFGAGGYDFWLVKVLDSTNIGSCSVISSPGVYQLGGNVVGAPNDALPLNGSSCIKIAASNVVFDCDGYNITNSGIPDDTYGIILNGSLSNVTVRNCPSVSGYKNGVEVRESTNVYVYNTTVANPFSGPAFNATSSTNVTYANDVAYDCAIGFEAISGSNHTYLNNTAYACTDGFVIESGTGNTFINNTAHSNSYGFEILSFDSNYSTFDGNRAFQNANNGFVIASSYNNLTNNLAFNDDAGFQVYGATSNTLINNSAYNLGIGFYSFDSVQGNYTYINNTAYNISELGFEIEGSDDIIAGNTIVNVSGSWSTASGFYFDNGYNNNITGNLVDNTAGQGIYFNTQYNATVANNVLINSSGGIYFSNPRNSAIVNNSALNVAGDGFNIGFLGYPENTSIVNNTASGDSGRGIFISLADVISNGNSITGNNASNDSYGIYIQYGVSPINTFANNILQENRMFDLYIIPDVFTVTCNTNITNNTGSGNRPINYTNDSVSWSNLAASEIILCDANGSNINNVTIRGSDTLNNNGLLVMVTANAAVSNSNSSFNNVGFSVLGGSNDTFSNNTASNNANNGFSTDSNSNGTVFSNDTASGNQADGFSLNGVGNSGLFGNAASNNGANGFGLYSSSGFAVSGNSAAGNGGSGFYFGNGASGSSVSGNSANGNAANGFYAYGSYYGLTNNTASGNSNDGFFMTGGFTGDTHDNTLTGNSAYGNANNGIEISLILANPPNIALQDNVAHGNSNGLLYSLGYGFTSTNDTFYDNSVTGASLVTSVSSDLTGDYFRNNSPDFQVAEVGYAPLSLAMSGVVFDSPAGNLTNYTNLTISDTVDMLSSYSINWSGKPAPLPVGFRSFGNKFVDITPLGGTVSIDSATWAWQYSDVGSHNESNFALYAYDAGWVDQNATLDTGAHTLALAGFTPASTYGILENSTGNLSVALGSPADGSTASKRAITFNCSANASNGLSNITLYGNFTGSWQAIQTNDVSGTSNSTAFTLNLSYAPYAWNCLAYDTVGISAWAPANHAFTADNLPLDSNFGGSTTDFSSELDLTNVSTPILEKPAYGKLQWNLNGLNVAGANFDTNVLFGTGWVSVNSPNLNSTLNSSANITLYGLPYQNTPVLYSDGVLCEDCTIISYVSHNLAFTVPHFTNYSAGPNTNLAIYSQYEGGNVSKLTDITFYANYTNATDSSYIPGATCLISFDDATSGVMVDTGSQYNFTKAAGFATTGVHLWNVTCNKTGYETLTAYDSIMIGFLNLSGNTTSLYMANVTNATALSRFEYNASGNLTTEGGNITGGNIGTEQLTDRWAAFYGNISGKVLLTDKAGANDVYQWGWSPTAGGVVCTSTNSTVTDVKLYPADGDDIDYAWSFAHTEADSGRNTFNQTGCSLTIGTTPITNASFADTGPAGGFITCSLKDTIAPAKPDMYFCTAIETNGTFWNGQTGNFELMVPTAFGNNAYETYYFYTNLN